MRFRELTEDHRVQTPKARIVEPFTVVGKTKVLFRVEVTPEFRAKIFEEIRVAATMLRAKGVGWAADTTFEVDCLCTDYGDVAHYRYEDDKIVINDVDDGRLCYLIVHELGHRFHIQCRDAPNLDQEINRAFIGHTKDVKDSKRLFAKKDNTKSVFPNDYSMSNRFEWFAETFAEWCHNRLDGYGHRQWFEDLIKKHNR